MTARRLLILCLLLAAVSSAVWATGGLTSEKPDDRLTHVITRGDLDVSIIEQGMLESAENTEIKCRVRGRNTVLWIVESGSIVQKGDELLRLDSSFIEEQIDERSKFAHWSRSSAERSAANLARAELAVSEFEEGQAVSQQMELEKQLVVAEARLRNAQDRLGHTRVMARSKYKSELVVEELQFAVDRETRTVELMQTQLDVLRKFTQKEALQILKGDLKAAKANHQANAERAIADASRRDRALEELPYCVVKAPRSGLVIHPNAAQWEAGPIEEGTSVHKDQVLLLMPDLNQMQVKVGVHEAVVDRIKEGMSARVTLPDGSTTGNVSKISSVTRPAGWWTANEVRYDTMVAVPPAENLKPGMSAEVEIVIAQHADVLTIPVAAIVEQKDSPPHCWVKTLEGIEKRELTLGDSNNVHTIVENGLQEGDEVLLNPPK